MSEVGVRIATRDELKAMSRDQLFASTRKAVNLEKDAIANVTRHFQEIYDRKDYLPKYASLFEMLKEEYGYCNGSAQLRLSSIRLIKDIPAVQDKIESGEISMSVAAGIQSFLYQEKIARRPYSENAKLELIEACIGKSKLEAQREFARRNPEIESRDIVRYTSDKRVRIDVAISETSLAKLNELRETLAHVKPNMTLGELIERLANDGEEKYSPKKKAERAAKRTEKKVRNFDARQKLVHPDEVAEEKSAQQSKPRTRYVAAEEKHQVPDDGQGCVHVDPKSGRRCGSTKFLQLDHIMPFSRGGENSARNLRWMCGAHNRWRHENRIH